MLVFRFVESLSATTRSSVRLAAGCRGNPIRGHLPASLNSISSEIRKAFAELSFVLLGPIARPRSHREKTLTLRPSQRWQSHRRGRRQTAARFTHKSRLAGVWFSRGRLCSAGVGKRITTPKIPPLQGGSAGASLLKPRPECGNDPVPSITSKSQRSDRSSLLSESP